MVIMHVNPNQNNSQGKKWGQRMEQKFSQMKILPCFRNFKKFKSMNSINKPKIARFTLFG